jgi:hypothetical protein
VRRQSVRLFVVAVLAVGCATAGPRMPMKVDCQSLQMRSVSNPPQRMEFPSLGYSILPPQGDAWCLPSAPGVRSTIFNTHPLMGKALETRPTDAEIRHTFGPGIVAAEAPKGAKLDTPADMFAFVVRELLGVAPGSRFTLVESRFVPDSSLGAECIRYDAIVEERDHPGARGIVLTGVLRDNFFCRHPDARTPTLIWISASERYDQAP